MASITIRHLDQEVKQRPRARAAERGQSMEDEARDLPRQVVTESVPPRILAAAIRAHVAPSHQDNLNLTAREPTRELYQSGKGR